jgi:hypothetical protein
MHGRKWIIAALALITVACGGDSLTAPTREITLCFFGQWAGYRNEGQRWTEFPSLGQVTFAATERLAIATVSFGGGPGSTSPVVEIWYLTAEQAEATFLCTPPQLPTKPLNGSVAGVAVGGRVVISMGRDVRSASASFPTFQISAPADGPSDLAAAHHPATTSDPPSDVADKVIIRRGENYAAGATMPALDFSSAEPFAPQSNTLTLQGATLDGTFYVQTTMTTQRGAYTDLRFDILYQGSATVTTTSVPASRLVDGDLHRAVVQGGGKRVDLFYRNPADRTASFGPALNEAVLTSPRSSDEALRFEVVAQPEYGSQVGLELATPQPSTSNTTIVIRATKEHTRGTPTTWHLVVPDLTTLPGFSPTWTLPPGGVGWILNATGLPYRFSATSAHDGDIYRSADANGVVQIGQ